VTVLIVGLIFCSFSKFLFFSHAAILIAIFGFTSVNLLTDYPYHEQGRWIFTVNTVALSWNSPAPAAGNTGLYLSCSVSAKQSRFFEAQCSLYVSSVDCNDCSWPWIPLIEILCVCTLT